MNPDFEYEFRTLNKPIPTSAIKGVYINKERFESSSYNNGRISEWLQNAKPYLDKMGIPVKIAPDVQSLRQSRATFRTLPKGSDLFGIGATSIGAGAGLQFLRNQSTPTPSQGGTDSTVGGRY